MLGADPVGTKGRHAQSVASLDEGWVAEEVQAIALYS